VILNQSEPSPIFSFSTLFKALDKSGLKDWREQLHQQLTQRLIETPHGDFSRWQQAVLQLPDITPDNIHVDQNIINIFKHNLQPEQSQKIQQSLRALMPWRKGPYQIFDTYINTEWRSDWKWERVSPHFSSLKNRMILDVGCGSGYHCWRMLGEGAGRVIGIDPNLLFFNQFQAVKKYIGTNTPVDILPIKLEDLPPQLEVFDTTFSMGVLYHRRSPIDHLLELKGTLVKGGELVLETLVIEGALGETLMPEDRYAMMRNVWFIPSCDTLTLWLKRAGFKHIKIVDKAVTSLDEQRSTDWMQYQSLVNFLDPEDYSKTVEGYPAPLRATLVAQKPFY